MKIDAEPTHARVRYLKRKIYYKKWNIFFYKYVMRWIGKLGKEILSKNRNSITMTDVRVTSYIHAGHFRSILSCDRYINADINWAKEIECLKYP